MNPFREAPLPIPRVRETTRFPIRKAVCWSIMAATLGPVFLQMQAQQLANPIDSVANFAHIGWVPWLAPIGFLALIISVLPAPEGDAKARLCRILWHCGEHGTAFGVYIGWIPLRLSQRRMDRNARAVQRFVHQRRRERYPWIKP